MPTLPNIRQKLRRTEPHPAARHAATSLARTFTTFTQAADSLQRSYGQSQAEVSRLRGDSPERRGAVARNGAETTTRPADLAPPRAPLDPAVREQLLLQHLPQVRYIARRIHGRLPAQIPLDDLVHAGVLGLMDAVGKFDPAKNVQLKSYAQFRIRGAILDSLRQMDWSPRQLRRQARRIEQAHRDLKARLGRVPTEVELAKEVELGLEEFQHLLGELRGLDLGSLQAESPEGIPSDEPRSEKPGDPERDPFSLCLHSEMRALVAGALEDLDVKERHVITLYYLKELTMKKVGAALGIGESRVSQIHSAALIRIRSLMEVSMRAPVPRCEPVSQTATEQSPLRSWSVCSASAKSPRRRQRKPSGGKWLARRTAELFS